MTDQSTEDARAEAFEVTYLLWQEFHRRCFGWNGPTGRIHADELFLTWDSWFFELNPTAGELMEATKWMASQPEMFDRSWESHFAWIKRRIMNERAELIKKNPPPLPAGQSHLR